MNKSSEKIKDMFNNIAPYYDMLNNLISFGLHKIIKKQCVNLLKIKQDMIILDLCTGTGDVAGMMSKFTKNVTGLDFSKKMFSIAQERYKNINFISGDCLSLPFKSNSYDVITMTYGLRNIEDRLLALKEVYRILKDGGKFLHLDFGEKTFAGCIFDVFVLIFAKIFSKDFDAYKYLLKSKSEFPNPNELINEIEKTGFKLLQRKDFIFHTISCQIFIK